MDIFVEKASGIFIIKTIRLSALVTPSGTKTKLFTSSINRTAQTVLLWFPLHLPFLWLLSHPHHVTWVLPIHSTHSKKGSVMKLWNFCWFLWFKVQWLSCFNVFFVFIHIGSQTWHSFPLHSIKFIDGWVTPLRRPFDYCKSRVVGKLLRQIHNNKQNSFFSLNHLVLFKFSFLYSPWEPVIILCRGWGWGGF